MSSKNTIISQIEAEQMEKNVPEFGPGDTVVCFGRCQGKQEAQSCRKQEGDTSQVQQVA